MLSTPSEASPKGCVDSISPERLFRKVEGEVTSRANADGVRYPRLEWGRSSL